MPYTPEVLEIRGDSAASANVILDDVECTRTQDLHEEITEETVAVTSERVKRDRQRDKRCIKCKQWLEKAVYFGVHNTSSDGYQSICKDCKKEANKRSLARNVTMRLRHHTATRCLDQLGPLAPRGFTKKLEHYLGYTMKALVRHLREDLKAREGAGRSLKDALNEGYHIDHRTPLSSYKVVIGEEVDWDEFKRCWAIENLKAIPARENLQKGAKIIDLSGD